MRKCWIVCFGKEGPILERFSLNARKNKTAKDRRTHALTPALGMPLGDLVLFDDITGFLVGGLVTISFLVGGVVGDFVGNGGFVGFVVGPDVGLADGACVGVSLGALLGSSLEPLLGT